APRAGDPALALERACPHATGPVLRRRTPFSVTGPRLRFARPAVSRRVVGEARGAPTRGGRRPSWEACAAVVTFSVSRRRGRTVRSESVDGLRDGRLAVRGLVRVDDALRDDLVELARRGLERGARRVLVARGDGLAHAAHV